MNHAWLLLADSALPLGSFAFSSSLESYISHSAPSTPKLTRLSTFLPLTLRSTATTFLPFICAAHRDPEHAAYYDDVLDAATTCSVARRASISQGRALLTVYEKSLSAGVPQQGSAVDAYRLAIRRNEASGHFAVAWGVVCRAFELEVEEVCYVFMFNHAKAVLSAAVRLGVCGPYYSQKILVGSELREMVKEAVVDGKKRSVEEAGQSVPGLDLYQGRHELLYSRVFNS
ncbi:urease accessory protein UreF [Ascodesmis nigricans]|uniref:Urease accessory protein UreF n=1 Tax=Ascodesmis nigricans TaxID=341454 RepID=A0A4S2MWU2_9PEZI|nr:urease accessory protein UreF [Ascodesmis nigricans]